MAAPAHKNRKLILKIAHSNVRGRKIFFAMEHLGSVLCLICQETIAVQKEYNINNSTKHTIKFDSEVGQARTDRINKVETKYRWSAN